MLGLECVVKMTCATHTVEGGERSLSRRRRLSAAGQLLTKSRHALVHPEDVATDLSCNSQSDPQNYVWPRHKNYDM